MSQVACKIGKHNPESKSYLECEDDIGQRLHGQTVDCIKILRFPVQLTLQQSRSPGIEDCVKRKCEWQKEFLWEDTELPAKPEYLRC